MEKLKVWRNISELNTAIVRVEKQG
jgi:hypothetical protein